jgi:large subunit ribosomal protein L30
MDSPKTGAPEGAPAGDSPKIVKITLVRSPLGNTGRHKATVRSLGLHRMHQTVEQVDTPQLRGMLNKIAHMVKVE